MLDLNVYAPQFRKGTNAASNSDGSFSDAARVNAEVGDSARLKSEARFAFRARPLVAVWWLTSGYFGPFPEFAWIQSTMPNLAFRSSISRKRS